MSVYFPNLAAPRAACPSPAPIGPFVRLAWTRAHGLGHLTGQRGRIIQADPAGSLLIRWDNGEECWVPLISSHVEDCHD